MKTNQKRTNNMSQDVKKLETDKEVLFVITTQEQEKTYREIEEERAKKDALKYAVKKLLMAKPEFIPQAFDKIVVRCNREANMWEVTFVESGKVEHKSALVIRNAVFTKKKGDKFLLSCGGKVKEFVGFAAGELFNEGTPVSVPKERVKRLGFDNAAGCFYCRETYLNLTACDYLILKEGCHSEYIEGKPGKI